MALLFEWLRCFPCGPLHHQSHPVLMLHAALYVICKNSYDASPLKSLHKTPSKCSGSPKPCIIFCLLCAYFPPLPRQEPLSSGLSKLLATLSPTPMLLYTLFLRGTLISSWLTLAQASASRSCHHFQNPSLTAVPTFTSYHQLL